MAKNIHKLKKINTKEKIDIWISVVVIMLCAALIYSHGFSNQEENVPEEYEASVEFEKVPQLKEIIIDGDLYNAEQTSADQIIRTETLDSLDDVSLVSSYKPNIISSSIASDSVSTHSSLDSLLAPANLVDSNRVMRRGATTDTTISSNILRNEENSQLNTEKVADQADQMKCVIILGAFRNSKNISQLLSKLNKSGFDSFTVPYKGLTRVGVDVSCDDNINAPVLVKLKSTYVEDAVLMRNYAK